MISISEVFFLSTPMVANLIPALKKLSSKRSNQWRMTVRRPMSVDNVDFQINFESSGLNNISAYQTNYEVQQITKNERGMCSSAPSIVSLQTPKKLSRY